MSRPAQAPVCLPAWRHQQRDEPIRWVTDLGQARDRHQLQQIIAGLSEGVILIEPGQRIVWGNEGY